MELSEAVKYAEMAIKAKKEIGKLASSDEMIVTLYEEIQRLQGLNESLQEEVIYYAEQEAGSSL